MKAASLTLAVTLLAAPMMAARLADDTPEKLRARIGTEGDPVSKARLEVRLADMVLEQTRKQYAANEF